MLVNLKYVDLKIALMIIGEFLYSLIKTFFGIFIALEFFDALASTVLFVSNKQDCSPKISSVFTKPIFVPFSDRISISPYLSK